MQHWSWCRKKKKKKRRSTGSFVSMKGFPSCDPKNKQEWRRVKRGNASSTKIGTCHKTYIAEKYLIIIYRYTCIPWQKLLTTSRSLCTVTWRQKRNNCIRRSTNSVWREAVHENLVLHGMSECECPGFATQRRKILLNVCSTSRSWNEAIACTI